MTKYVIQVIGVHRNFSTGGAKSKFSFGLSFSAYWQCSANGRAQSDSPFLHQKENAWSYGNSCKRVFPL